VTSVGENEEEKKANTIQPPLLLVLFSPSTKTSNTISPLGTNKKGIQQHRN